MLNSPLYINLKAMTQMIRVAYEVLRRMLILIRFLAESNFHLLELSGGAWIYAYPFQKIFRADAIVNARNPF